jgi:hypothetical protein
MVEKVTWPDMGYPSDTVLIEWHRYEEKNYYGQWDELPHDPLLILIVHSDCEGDILPEHATLLADRLDEILPNIDDKDDGGHIGHRGGYRACDLSPVLGMQRLRTSQ